MIIENIMLLYIYDNTIITIIIATSINFATSCCGVYVNYNASIQCPFVVEDGVGPASSHLI